MVSVTDTRPAGARPNYNDTSSVPKYELPTAIYETKTDSVLAWKKAQKLGRFDPDAPSLEQAKFQALEKEIKDKGIEVGKRCRVGGEDTKRGTVMYVGNVEEIPGGSGAWVGVKLDEPVLGKEGDAKSGVFVRPERVEIGEWPVLDDLEDMEEM
ncbi:Cell polarity protein alp11 [Lachnellula suecica]|uniref:Cell polarity protein alp11 n=1 Tax=Lachnellula suecica TaxID=602035 RepID=A0A8T9C061_9HELO|nr:Cell polarity protein alp11 [Lachnellula suecica]